MPTLYAWAGGAEAFARLTSVYYGKHVALCLGEVPGGPPACSEAQGGHGHMVAGHMGRAITERQRRRWVDLIQDAADEAGPHRRNRADGPPGHRAATGRSPGGDWAVTAARWGRGSSTGRALRSE